MKSLEEAKVELAGTFHGTHAYLDTVDDAYFFHWHMPCGDIVIVFVTFLGEVWWNNCGVWVFDYKF